ncbi:MAG: DUF5069 domain-containing protein [Methylacidiphilales bacterium]|nr:DUF5069 domain-containing protein [Candidatus Methylacidiphilales bacterium]
MTQTPYPVSPYVKTKGIVYFARMLDKIRLHANGKLGQDFIENLGIGFDGRCLSFLKISYEDLKKRVLQGGSDDEILQWCFSRGRHPGAEEIEIWNHFMAKRGCRDEASERLEFRLNEAGLSKRKGEILTFFDFIEVDEGRPPQPDWWKA